MTKLIITFSIIVKLLPGQAVFRASHQNGATYDSGASDYAFR